MPTLFRAFRHPPGFRGRFSSLRTAGSGIVSFVRFFHRFPGIQLYIPVAVAAGRPAGAGVGRYFEFNGFAGLDGRRGNLDDLFLVVCQMIGEPGNGRARIAVAGVFDREIQEMRIRPDREYRMAGYQYGLQVRLVQHFAARIVVLVRLVDFPEDVHFYSNHK